MFYNNSPFRYSHITSLVFWVAGDQLLKIFFDKIGITGIICFIITFIICTILDELGDDLIFGLLQKLPFKKKNVFVVTFGLFLVLVATNAIVVHYTGDNILSAIGVNIETTLLMLLATCVFKYIRFKYIYTKLSKKIGDGTFGIKITKKDFKSIVKEHSKYNKQILKKFYDRNAIKLDSGIYVGTKNHLIYSFKGIPYAKDISGERRFLPPEKLEPSQNVYEAKHYGECYPQNDSFYMANSFIQGDDCLNLNIWTNNIISVHNQKNEKRLAKAKSIEKKPVIIYVPGGDGFSGASSMPIYDGEEFIKNNNEVVLVTINYRLGFFASIDLSMVEGGDKYKNSSCLMLFDIIEALKWVNKNIYLFGGDNTNVTLIGDTCASNYINILSTLDETKGLYSKAVMLAGSNVTINSKEKGEYITKKIVEAFNIHSVDDLINLPYEKILEFQTENDDLIPAPIAGLSLVPQNMYRRYKDGCAIDKTIIECVVADPLNDYIAYYGESELLKIMSEFVLKYRKTLSTEENRVLDKIFDDYKDDILSAYKVLVDVGFFQGPQFLISKLQVLSGGTSYTLEWNIKSPIKKIGANSMGLVSNFFGNFDFAEKYGVIGDDIQSSTLQKLIINFAVSGKPKIEEFQYKDLDAKEWKKNESGKINLYVFDSDGFKRMDTKELAEFNKYEYLYDKYLI